MVERIVIVKSGRLGNNLFQFAFAKYLSDFYGGVPISNFEIPEIGLSESPDYKSHIAMWDGDHFSGHHFPLTDFELNSHRRVIFTSAWGMRKEFFSDKRSYLLDFLPSNFLDTKEVEGRERVLCHIRGGDLWRSVFKRNDLHQDYFPLPVSFYKQIMERSGKPLHFLVERSTPYWYLRLLLSSLKGSTFQFSRDVFTDFRFLANANDLALSISTFSYMAGFLGNGNIYMPIGGLFDPSIRPDIEFFISERFTQLQVKTRLNYGNILDLRKLSQ